MKYNYQLVMNIFICERNPNATLADGFLLTGQTTVYELGGGGGGVECLCGYHCFRSTPLFKTWHLQVMSVASQKLHRSRPFPRLKLIYLSQIFSSSPRIKTVHTDCLLHTWNTTARQFWLLVQNTWLRHTAKNTVRLPGVSVGSRGNLEWNLSDLKVVV